MSFRDGPLQDLKVPLAFAGGAAAIIAVVAALFFLVEDRAPAPRAALTGVVRSRFDQTMGPISAGLAAPVRWTGEARTGLAGYFDAVNENRRLKAVAVEAQRLRDEVQALKNLNHRYETVLGLRTEPAVPMVAARVVADAHSPYSNARLIDVGPERGVKVGNPVISERGVIGRIVGTAKGISRVLMLTDPQSRTPVLVNSTKARAILTGDGGDTPRLVYLRGKSPVKVGDVILTSGDGGLYPRGLPVGVAEQDVFGQWRVRLYADGAPLDFVQVLKFEDFSQLALNNTALEEHQIPPLTAGEQAQIQASLAARNAPPPPKVEAPKTDGAKPEAAPVPATAKPTAAPATKPAGAPQ